MTGNFSTMKGGSLTGVELTNQVLANPQILWQKYFFIQLRRLEEDQKEVVLEWFNQMTNVSICFVCLTLFFLQLQEIYIGEIEKANNYLKMLVCQGYERLHTSERFKQEFIAKINHIENRVYFQKKRKTLMANLFDSEAEGGQTLQKKPYPASRRTVGVVAPPSEVMVAVDKEARGEKEQDVSAAKAPSLSKENEADQGVTGIAPKTDKLIS